MANEISFRVDVRVLREIINKTPGRLSKFMDEEAEAVKNDIIASFGASPAAPGNPPGVDTDTLRGSIDWDPDGEFRRLVMDGVEYGVWLELGSTRHPYRWPFVGPAFERERNAFADHAQRYGLVKR